VSAPVLFRGVDRATCASAFSARLHDAGLQPPIAATARFADALDAVAPRTRQDLYWVARTCLVDDIEQLVRFEGVFDAIFDRASSSLSPVERRTGTPRGPARDDDVDLRVPGRSAREPGGGGVPWTTRPSAAEPDPELDVGIALPELLPSDVAAIAEVPFDELDEAQLTAIGAIIEAATVHWPRRRARRRRRSPRRRTIDRRGTMRAAMRTAGEPVRLAYVEPVRRPRGVVMIADVSGSMQSYARAYLHLMRALSREVDAETFAFSTRLTRVTATLRHRDARTAIQRATAEVEDRFGGTRIASSLGQLLRDPAWSTSLRGAVVVIASDGWDTDPPADLDGQMQRLARMAHRVVWVNPRAVADGFAPTVAGMAAALPHCDAMVSGHSLAAMRDLFEAIAPSRSLAAQRGVGYVTGTTPTTRRNR